MSQRAVITGIGIVSPVGNGRDLFWKNLLAGHTGVREISLLDASSFPCHIAAEVSDFQADQYLTNSQLQTFSRSAQFSLAAFKMCVSDSAIEYFDPYRTDVIIGAGSISFEFVDEQLGEHPTVGRTFIPGLFDKAGITKYNINTPAAAIAQSVNSRGFVTTLSTACAGGLTAIGLAYQRIKAGEADYVIAGATDAPINLFSLNLFSSAGFLCTADVDPSDALCPFDLRRTRSVFGEGACILIIEELENALLRGAKIYAEIEGFEQEYENTDEMLHTDRTGKRWAELLSRVIGGKREQVDYINAHATSDVDLDAIEADALSIALGAEKSAKIPISSIKGATGSPFATAGALQVATTALSLYDQKLPPSYNYKIPDPRCKVAVLKHPRRHSHLRRSLVNTHAFAGVNAALVLRALH